MWELDYKESWALKNWCFNCCVEEDSWESLGLQGDPTSPSSGKSDLNIHWKDWCWSWNSNTLAIWCKELTHWKRPWCWERLKGAEGDNRGWYGWKASLTWWTWVWVSSGSWWWTGKPGILQSMGSKKVGHDWVTKLNWTDCSDESMCHIALHANTWLLLLITPLQELLAKPCRADWQFPYSHSRHPKEDLPRSRVWCRAYRDRGQTVKKCMQNRAIL